MTDSAEGTETAATEVDDAATSTASTVGDAASSTSDQSGTDLEAEISKWKALARKHEDRAKANDQSAQLTKQQLAAVAKALGLDTGDALTPEKLQAQLADRDKAVAERDQILRDLQVERAAEKVATKAGADPELLLPALAYKGLLDDLDPSDADFSKNLERIISDQLKANPKFAAVDQFPDLRQGNRGAATGGEADPNAWLRQLAGR